jgi:hypothetical protein
MQMKPLVGPMKPVGTPRKKFTMPLVVLAESPQSSSPSLGMDGNGDASTRTCELGAMTKDPCKGMDKETGMDRDNFRHIPSTPGLIST